MAVQFDQVSDSGGNFNADRQWQHVPVGTPAGVCVQIVSQNIETDFVATVTYGGVELPEVSGSPYAKAAGTSCSIHTFLLGSGVPSGEQTVSVTMSGSPSLHRAVAVTVTTDGGDVEVDATGSANDGATNGNTLAVPIATTDATDTVDLWAFFSDENNPAHVSIDVTELSEGDFGNNIASFGRADGAGGTVTATLTHSAAQAAGFGVALREVAASGVTGSGSAQLGALSASGSGDVEVEGSGSGTLAPLSALGDGAVSVEGSGSGALAPLSAAGSGTVSGGGSDVTPTLLTAEAQTTNGMLFTTESVDLVAGRRYIIGVAASDSGGATELPTIGGVGSWSPVDSSVGGFVGIGVFECVAATTESGVVTLTYSVEHAGCAWAVIEIAGDNTGAALASNDEASGATLSFTLDLLNPPAADSLVIAFHEANANEACDPNGANELVDLSHGAPNRSLHVVWDIGTQSLTSSSASSVVRRGVIIEIPAAVVGGGVSGSGSANLGPLSASGSGDVEVTGSGDAMLGALSADGTGAVDVAGSGAAQLGAFSASGSGEVDVTGAGDAQLGPLSASGSGIASQPGSITGSGAAQLGPLTAEGTGSVDITGEGSASLDSLSAQGAGVVDLTGSGDASLGALDAQGAGVVDVTGSGELSLSAQRAQGAGVVDITGSGAAQLAPLAASGRATTAVLPDEWWAYPAELRWDIEHAPGWGIGPAELRWEVET